MNKNLFATIALAAASLVPAYAAHIEFTYDTSGSNNERWGTSTSDVYDVAIRLAGPEMVGKKVKSISVALYADAVPNLAIPSAFITTELGYKDGANVTNIASVEAKFKDDKLVATFPEPYTITDKGVYVGYSFAVNELDAATKFPLLLGQGDNPDGFYIHTKRKFLKWGSKAEELGFVSNMRVTLEGDFPAYSVGLNRMAEALVPINKTGYIEVRAVNFGQDPVQKLEYTYTVGDKEPVTMTYELPQPIGKTYGTAADLLLPIKAQSQLGTFPLSITVTKVNDEENVNAGATINGEMTVMSFVPKNKPLFEEYTGLWCGYCPKGYVGIEMMNERHPKDFVALSYHFGNPGSDPMMVSAQICASPSNSYPAAYFNRHPQNYDAYWGSTGTELGIEQDWQSYASQAAVADIDAEADWNDDMTQIVAKAKVRFVKSYSNANFRIGFALVGNGMSDPDWAQSNYFSQEAGLTGELWDIFTKGGSKIKGLVYNDVVVAFPNKTGIPSSLPADIDASAEYVCTYNFDLSTVKNYNGDPIIQDKEKLHVVTVLIDADSKLVLNSNKTGKMGLTSVQSFGAEEGIVATEYFDMTGRRVANPERGIYVKVDTLANGTRRSSKVAL